MKVAIRVLSSCSMVYAILAFIANSMGVLHATPMWYLQAGSFLVGGLVVFGATFIDNFKLPTLTLPSQPEAASEVTKKQVPPKEISLAPSKLEEMDNKNLYYLSARARVFGDDEALTLLKHLERHFWCQHHGVANAKTIVKVKSDSVSTSS